MPDLSGPAADAEDTLADARLTSATRSEAFSDSVAAGEVISQDPAAGTEVERRLHRQLRHQPGRRDRRGARSLRPRRRRRGRRSPTPASPSAPSSEAFSDSVAAGEVISQDPAAGTRSSVGSTVDYVISLGVETVAVPDLSGPAADAEDTLAAAGLTVGDVERGLQ